MTPSTLPVLSIVLAAVSLLVQAWNAFNAQKARADLLDLKLGLKSDIDKVKDDLREWSDGRYVEIKVCDQRMAPLDRLITAHNSIHGGKQV